MIKRLCFYLVGLALCLRCWGDASANKNDLESKAQNFEAAYRAKCSDLGYADRVEVSGNPNFFDTTNLQYQQDVTRIRDDDSYTLVFLKGSGQLIEFTDEKAYDKLFGQGARTYTTPSTPQWSPEKAIALAKPFLPIFLRDRKVFLANPQPKYIHTVLKNEGFWQITWRRTDSKGHPFEYDETVLINVSETAGPLGGYINLAAVYVEPTGEPLKQSDVQDKAWKMAQQTLGWGPVKGMLDPGHLDPKPIRADLRVVRPNHLLDHKEVNTHADLNARLAWVFWYAWRLDNTPNQIQSVSVWIDAYTGDILGGDAAMN